MAEDLLRLEGLCKSHNVGTPAQTEVLHDVELHLRHGDFTALMGPSGSGKSTLLNIIGLLDRPTRGKLFIDGRDTSTLDDGELTRLRAHTIGFVFQYHYLLSAITALENVMMPMLLEQGRPDTSMRQRALDLLERVGLLPWQGNLAPNLSGGQQQRVAVARALALSPSLILADEPTGNLDSRSADAVFELLREENAARGTTMLVVTHNHELARRCGRIIQLVDGRIVSDQKVS